MPAALLLALSGAVLATAPASAAPAGLTITSPVQGSTVDSRTVTVTGSVFGGSTVIVYTDDADKTVLARTNPGGTFGQPTSYSLTLPAYAADAPVAQSVIVGGIYGGSGIPEQRLAFNLPAAAPAFNFTVTSPTEGEMVESRTVTFTGTGTDGSTVNVLTPEGDRVPGTTAAVVVNGTWSTTGTYADDAAIDQTVNVNQVTGGAGRGSAEVSFVLPAVAPEFNFTVTSPTEGEMVESRTVTFTGTGTDGSTVNVLTPEGDRVPGTTAAVVVNGTWSTTGTYADDAAIDQTVNVNQVTGGAGRGSAEVSFVLPAVAPEFNFTVTSPTEGEMVESRTVTFTGTGTDGSTVNVLTPEGDRVPGTTAAVVVNGTWSTTGTYADDAAIDQTVNVNQVTGGAGRGSAEVSFVLPAVAPEFNFTVTSPTEGEMVESRTVTFTGTGTDGSTVNVLTPEGDRVPGTTAAVVVNGTWSTTGTYADDAAIDQTVNVNQVTGGAGRGQATVSFTLPAVGELPAPVITSPVEGEIVVGDQVTFTGTGQPGAFIGLLVVPTELIEEASPNARVAAAEAAVPADPTDPIPVDENGDWEVTVALLPEDYTAIAIQSSVENPTELDQVSLPSAPVSFTLEAAPVVDGPGTPPGTPDPTPAPAPGASNGAGPGASNGGGLAVTGAETLGLGAAALLLVAGGGFLIARRRGLIG